MNLDVVTQQTLLDKLTGLTRLSWSLDGAELGWRWNLPAWAWLLILLASLAFAGWSYGRLLGPMFARVGLCGVRTILILFIIALIAGPMLVLPQEQIEPDALLILVDRSASMQIEDVRQGERVLSREQSLRQALKQNEELFGPEKLGRDRRLVWLGFDAGAFAMGESNASALTLEEPQGRTTAIRTAIEQALDHAGSRPISGIVLMTDGRSHQSTGVEMARRLEQQAVSVFSVPLGAEKTPLDLALGRVQSPDRAFINDNVPVHVWVDRFPFDAPLDGATVKVVLTDTATGATLDEETLDAKADSSQPVRLSGESAVAGPARWRVEIVYEPAASDPDARELVTQNNTGSVNVELVDRPIRVLLVEGYPRWEYRYLKNLLVRESNLESSVLLISADPNFAQEGDLPITRMPVDSAEMEPYDVIIIGDVPAEYFSTEELNLVRDQVAARGAGLLLIGGSYQMPRSYEATSLADLLPMRRPGSVQARDAASGPYGMMPTPLAESLNVLRLLTPELTDARTQQLWPTSLPKLTWVQDLGQLKPAVETVATVAGSDEQPVPAVVRLRYGAGESVYMGTDETWRWRFGKGELYFEQFWTQIIQMLGRGRMQRHSDGLSFDVSHRRLELDQPMVVRLRITDPLLLRRELPNIAVEVVRADDPQGSALERIELLPKGNGSDGDSAAEYEALWRPMFAGTLVLRVVEAALDDRNLSQQVEVIHPDDELRQPATDHARLANLSEATGGKVVPLDELDQLMQLVPNRARRTPIDIREPLWDSPLALMLVLLLLTLEWVGRKMIRLT